MFVVVEEGSKQYIVKKNDVLVVERMKADVGSLVSLSSVPYVTELAENTSLKDVKVTAEVLEHKRADKIIVFKKKRRHNYRRKNGHRQNVTVLRIKNIGEE